MKPKFVLLLTFAVLFEGLRAGAGTFRMLIDLPARENIGPIAFADFSRATDLSHTGIVFYALYGIGGAAITAATWFVARRTRASSLVRRLTGLATLCSLLILVFTAKAAPLMWAIGSNASNPAEIKDLLDQFTWWTDLRVVCADVSFASVVIALANGVITLR